MKTVIWWIRRDLRLTDNQALAEALVQAEEVLPVFVLDPNILDRPTTGPARVAFMLGGLRQLDIGLRQRGSRLVVRRGNPAEALAALADETGAEAIFAEEDHSPYARQRDGEVAARLDLTLTGGRLVHPPGTVLKADGDPYTVFTPFSRTWRGLPLPGPTSVLPPPQAIPTPTQVNGLPIPRDPALPPDGPFPPGEVEAQRRLWRFIEGDDPAIHHYGATRDRVDLDGTSGLSPYLRFGILSARQAVVAAVAVRDATFDENAHSSADTWLNELIWREFYAHILAHFPHVVENSFRPQYEKIDWENDEGHFVAWCEGRTGYPLVDAAMRQLNQTGWMHNRARMVTASFLVKDLLIDWRWGERYFMQKLVDGDAASNNGGWQWSAGTGTDAAPYFRIFNPTSQAKKHDPNGEYARRWVPELAQVPGRHVHEPWKMDKETQQRVGCIIGTDYVTPIVDHRWARERTLAAYRKARE
jgi:deoxyribodipyrimidine photo-lyase